MKIFYCLVLQQQLFAKMISYYGKWNLIDYKKDCKCKQINRQRTFRYAIWKIIFFFAMKNCEAKLLSQSKKNMWNIKLFTFQIISFLTKTDADNCLLSPSYFIFRYWTFKKNKFLFSDDEKNCTRAFVLLKYPEKRAQSWKMAEKKLILKTKQNKSLRKLPLRRVDPEFRHVMFLANIFTDLSQILS